MNAMKAIKRLRAAALALSAFVVAHPALACSVCAVGKEESRGAYYFTTAFLSLLPLAMIGGIVYTIVKKSR